MSGEPITLYCGGTTYNLESIRDADEVMETEFADCRRRGYQTRKNGTEYQIRDGQHESWLTIGEVVIRQWLPGSEEKEGNE